jgi:signal transduction histidine kinase
VISAPQLRRDARLPALLALVGTAEAISFGGGRLWLAIASCWLAAAILCTRGFAPLAMPVAVAAVYALTAAAGYDVSELATWLLLIPFACLSAGLHAPRERRLAGLASTLAALALTMAGLAWFTAFDPDLLFGLIVSLGPWGMGVALRRALDESRRLGAEAEQARLERALAAQRAAESERARISAELHDVLAHTLGAMVVQSSVASDLIVTDSRAAAAALRGVEEAGRRALAETGRLLRLLRGHEDELGLPASAAPHESDPTPPEHERAPTTLRPLDLLVPAAIAIAGTVELAWYGYGPLRASIPAFWLEAGVLCARRRAPLAMPVVVAAIAVTAELLGIEAGETSVSLLTYGLASFAAGFHVPRARAAHGLASVLASAGITLLGAVALDDVSWDAVLVLGIAVGPWAVGVGLRQALERSRELAAEAERARVEVELEAERGAAAERRRIARELHDVLANSLSVMVVQAAVAAEQTGRDPVAATVAVAAVERAGRTALAETGALLRRIGDDAGGRHPRCGLADLSALADEFASAGLAIDLDLEPLPAPLPLGVELSTYRIVQEALTNTLKHAPGSRVRVRLARDGAAVAIEVCNGRAGSRPLAAHSGGHGLVGLHERATIFGGRLDAGPTSDGGFRLAVTLPVEAA